jgi:hypothetical protein
MRCCGSIRSIALPSAWPDADLLVTERAAA